METELIKNYYVKILERIEKANLNVRKEDNKKLACYFYNEGEFYNRKLMVIGRAGNGGTEEFCWKQGDSDRKNIEEFVQKTYNRQLTDSLHWVSTQWGKRFNEKGEKQYNSATPFWKLIKAILKRIEGEMWDEKIWPLKIVWSNVYKFSPVNGGNPNYTLQTLQLDYCREILKFEIQACKPQNILFITGEKWFDSVKDIFYIDNTKNVFKYKDGTIANVYVCERPEFRAISSIADAVLAEITYDTIKKQKF